MDAIFDSLQREFCPPLDSSLLAALLADLDLDALQEPPSISTPQIAQLRSTLLELAAQADAESMSALEDFSCSDDTSSTPDFCTTTTTTSASDMSQRSSSFNSPLGFLKATMPHIPLDRLAMALSEAEVDTPEDEIDMWEIIATILSEETEKEMRERDLNEEELNEIAPEAAWETVETKKAARKAKKKAKGSKITLSDVRQQQHARPSASQSARSPLVDDPWSQLASLCTHVASVLPPYQPAFFSSFFHSPEHASTPYNALCAALTAICAASPPAGEHTATLYNLLDLLLPSYEDLDDDGRTRLVSDVELALGAAQGRGEDAFELVKVLRDLDSDAVGGHYEIGVYHSPVVSAAPPLTPSPLRSATQGLPDGPSPTPPPPPKPARAHTVPVGAGTGGKPSPFQWQAVPPRRRAPAPRAVHEHAMHIPTYRADVNGTRVRRGAGASREAVGGGGGDGSVSELAAYKRRVGESIRKRDEMLREAARMWQRGNKRTRGGEVAFYFAERAREFQEVARREALDAARLMVQSKRFTSGNRDTVDLHGATAAEAIAIVNEILAEKTTWSLEKPLKIITGRGTHSAGQVSVLKPAVRRALEEDGWVVGQWDGGLTVRGRRGARGVS